MDNLEAIQAEMEKDLEEVNAGKITFLEFQRRQYIRRQNYLAPKLLEYARREDWQEFINMALACYEVLPIAIQFYRDIPDNLKYEFCTQAYINHGDSLPAVRKAVREALKYGRPELPEELKQAQEITVYRAGEEPPEKAKYRISWTTDKTVAEFFLNTYIGRHATHLYRGKIKPCHIIAYTNDRNEKEIMQYRHVFNIEDISP